jgi:PAS domain S-box-containing protein
MELPKLTPESRVGVCLSGLEGGGELIRRIKEYGYSVYEVPHVNGADSAALEACDLLVVSWHERGSLHPPLRGIEGEKPSSDPGALRIVLCPAKSDLSELDRGDLGEDDTLLPYPLDPPILLFQIIALLDRRRTSHNLRYRLKEREDVLRSISEVFFSVDHEFRYTFFNEQAQKIGGKSYQEVIGKSMWDMFPFLKNTEFERQMYQAAADRKIFISEYLGAITGGWFEMRIYPSAGGLSVLFVDISARKKAEESLRKAQEQLTAANTNLERAVKERTSQLHAANERLEELLYSIAHDLRSPLRSMQGFAQAFLDDYCTALDDRARDYGKRMTSAAIFMDRMLKDLLELSRITRTDLGLESVSLIEAWESALVQQEEKIRSTQAGITRVAELGSVIANPTLLVQILANLLGNALKFTRKNVRPEIKIWSEEVDDRTLAFYIEDNGIGIDGRYHDKVFRVFERLNGAEYEGTGIGLAIARKAAERMKGHLDFTSTPGSGTRFRLTLPKN